MSEVLEQSGEVDIDLLSEVLARFEVRDLSHQLEEGIPFFPTHSRFYHMPANRDDDPAMMFQILMHEHNGTHVDAPAHDARRRDREGQRRRRDRA